MLVKEPDALHVFFGIHTLASISVLTSSQYLLMNPDSLPSFGKEVFPFDASAVHGTISFIEGLLALSLQLRTL